MKQNSEEHHDDPSAHDDFGTINEDSISSGFDKAGYTAVRTTMREKSDHVDHNGEPEIKPSTSHLKPTTIHLPRQIYIQMLVLAYAVMFVTGWAILAVTSRHPIGRKSYYCDSNTSDECYSESLAKQINSRTQSFISNAQTILSAVSVLTIPLTSAVCAAAVVPWLQHSGKDISLRQLLTLADRGWTSPYVYSKLSTYSGWRRYGSAFLALSLVLHGLGAALSPAISKLSQPVSIKVPTTSVSIRRIMTIDNILDSGASGRSESLIRLRDSLRTVSPLEYQPRLWQQHSLNCTAEVVADSSTYDYTTNKTNTTADQCSYGGLNYKVLPSLKYPFISQLPNGFTTGVDTNQVIPRINSSVNVTEISQLPSECRLDSAALSIHLSGTGTWVDTNATNQTESYVYTKWAIQACVIDYGQSSRFSNTTGPQFITEVLYLNAYAYGAGIDVLNATYRIEVNTTLGYFELPNYKRGNVAGDLMTAHYVAPSKRNEKRDMCSDSSYVDESCYAGLSLVTKNNASLSTRDLETLANKGPLLNTAYALFGNGSYPETFVHSNSTYNTGYIPRDTAVVECRDIVPLSRLASTFYNGGIGMSSDGCLTNWDLVNIDGMYDFVGNLVLPPDDLANVFLTAAYMSHEIMLNAGDFDSGDITVQYDAGVDFQKPGLSLDAIIVLSLVIALFLLCLIILSTYAWLSRSWTYSLDAYAMLRIGADLGSDVIPFYAMKDADQIVEMDDLPGFVGDVAPEDSEYGILGLGIGSKNRSWHQPRPIRKDRRYLSSPEVERGWWQMDLIVARIFSLNGRRQTNAGARSKRIREEGGAMLYR